MGIYLPKVDMPQGEETLTIQICPDGSIWQRFRGTVPGAKAVSVLPHGRLIDASEKIRVQMYDDMTEDYHIADMTIDDLLGQGWVEAAAPTIIPAEE